MLLLHIMQSAEFKESLPALRFDKDFPSGLSGCLNGPCSEVIGMILCKAGKRKQRLHSTLLSISVGMFTEVDDEMLKRGSAHRWLLIYMWNARNNYRIYRKAFPCQQRSGNNPDRWPIYRTRLRKKPEAQTLSVQKYDRADIFGRFHLAPWPSAWLLSLPWRAQDCTCLHYWNSSFPLRPTGLKRLETAIWEFQLRRLSKPLRHICGTMSPKLDPS